MLNAHSIASDVKLVFAPQAGEMSGEIRPTVLKQRKTGGLVHVGKPYWNGDVLLTQVVNPTAGFFAGDELNMSIHVEAGSRVLLNQPGATRIHTMEPGREARINQHFYVESGASLDVYPDLSISQRGSSLRQKTALHIGAEARCCFLEILTPGRIAHGDALEWNLLSNGLDIYCDEKRVVRERMHLTERERWRLQNRQGQPMHLATFWVYHPDVESFIQAASSEQGEGLSYGHSYLSERLACIRFFTASSVALRNAVRDFRLALSELDSAFGTSNALY